MMHYRDDDEDSNDDFMGNMGAYDAQSNPLGLSKAELRKNNKPIMEKKRRARINNCLNELKTLILDALKKDPARHTKLEKADILEMTVKHLQTVQRSNKYGNNKQQHFQHHQHQHLQQQQHHHQSDGVLHKFQAGFADCTQEVSRYISQMTDVDTTVKQRLIGHLSNCAGGLQQHTASGAPPTVPFSYGTPSPLPPSAYANGSPPAATPTLVGGLQQPPISMGGVQLIPSRLPTGELALVMPNSSQLAYFPSSVAAANTTTDSTTTPASTTTTTTSSSAMPKLDLSASYPRMPGAFSIVSQQNNNKHQSPPLSPSSSISTLGDDSSLSAVDYQSPAATPPPSTHQSAADLLMASCFPTPHSDANTTTSSLLHHPLLISTDSTMMTTTTTTVQQPQISSTTNGTSIETSGAKVKPLSVITNTNQRNIHNNSSVQQQQQRSDLKRTYAMLNDGETPPMLAGGGGGGLLQLSTIADGQPLTKMPCKVATTTTTISVEGGDVRSGGGDRMAHNAAALMHANDLNGDMWRPW